MVKVIIVTHYFNTNYFRIFIGVPGCDCTQLTRFWFLNLCKRRNKTSFNIFSTSCTTNFINSITKDFFGEVIRLTFSLSRRGWILFSFDQNFELHVFNSINIFTNHFNNVLLGNHVLNWTCAFVYLLIFSISQTWIWFVYFIHIFLFHAKGILNRKI